MEHREEREMSISRKDFYRLLPVALKNYEYSESGNCIFFSYYEGEVNIVLGEESSRQIASLTLPLLHVQFIFKDINYAYISGFMNNFSRVYQRGGG